MSKIEEKSWAGVMQCEVINQTGRTIEYVRVFKVMEGYTDELPTCSLDNGQSKSFELHVGSGSDDLWSISFSISYDDDAHGAGGDYTRQNKQCNVESEDWESGRPVRVIFYDRNNGFTIDTPVSSSCDNNHYD